jgi:hypothetical protein
MEFGDIALVRGSISIPKCLRSSGWDRGERDPNSISPLRPRLVALGNLAEFVINSVKKRKIYKLHPLKNW